MTKTILSILFIGAAVLVFVLYISPTYDTIREDRTRVANIDAALEKTREIQELKSSLLSRYNIFSSQNLDRLQRMLPDHVDNVRLILDIDGIASRYGIRIQNVAVQESGAAAESDGGTVLNGGSGQSRPYQSLTVQFQVVAGYEDFISLLRDLEASLRVVDLVSLSVDPSGQQAEGAPQQYAFDIALRTYWLR